MATRPEPLPPPPTTDDDDPLADLTAEERVTLAGELNASFDEIDRGETVDADEVFAALRAKIDATSPRR